MRLRSYQKKFIESIHEAGKKNLDKAIFMPPIGSGKTWCKFSKTRGPKVTVTPERANHSMDEFITGPSIKELKKC
ncbi:MAG: hypothetical protein KAR42_15195 [candidate division Zixibacteria bacterium]|nr:hypothetical protein [candidate division Zixibacteria bacterium]